MYLIFFFTLLYLFYLFHIFVLIGIRQLQLILLKVALLLGVEVHENVGFESLIEPPEDQSEESMLFVSFFNLISVHTGVKIIN